ncbi:DUF917 domain-containing protein [Bacillus sp. 1P06AnD]|uniref:DUF917 domain-containing protein n=1 Tax=Bacillus sp. 1P06AnD TaxID=3132208 RepID=UPI0039A32FBB
MSWHITKADISYISLGARFLSSGGGGDTKTFEYLLKSLMSEKDVIEAKTADELGDEQVIPMAVVGSPLLLSEDIPSLSDMVRTLALYEQLTDKKGEAVMPIEIGGMNALTPIVIAYLQGMPVVDGDAMGRAFPDLFMSLFSRNTETLFPLMLVSGKEEKIIRNKKEYNEQFQPFVLENKGYAFLACHGGRGRRLVSCMVPGTLKLSRQLGLSLSSGTFREKLNAVREDIGNSIYGQISCVCFGRVTAVKKWFEEKRLIGTCHINGFFHFAGRQAHLYFQNEFLKLALSDGKCYGVPDLIILLRQDNGQPVSVSEIREGMIVAALVISAPSALRTEEMMRSISPGQFGLEKLDCLPLHEGGDSDEDWD